MPKCTPLLKQLSHKCSFPPPRRFAEVLLGYQDVFQSGQAAGSKTVTLHPQLRGFEERTAAVDRVLVELQGKGVVNGWRGERYPVLSSFHSPPLLALERAAAVSFGIKAYGVLTGLKGFVSFFCLEGG